MAGLGPLSPRAPFAFGAVSFPLLRVPVMWSDGNLHPGAIARLTQTHHLVVFPGGRQERVAAPCVRPAE